MNIGKKQSKRFWVFSLILLCLISCISSQAIAGGKDPNNKDPNNKEDLFKMSLEELMEVPVITSASRQPQKMGQSSAFVSVITAEDIHYSGLTSIPEILQFTPGVDVRKFDRRRYGVGVRGLFSRTSDRTLVLVNGRYANDSVFGSPDWAALPVLIEDIERIEVVHGPSGASWGANAATGVINIITKKPKDVLGGFASTTISQFGDSYTHLRMAEKKDAWSWRVSAGYEDLKDSDQAGAGKYRSGQPSLNGLMGFPDSFAANDFMRSWRFDSEAEYQVSEETKLSFGVGHSNFEAGSSELVGYLPQRDDMTSLTRAFMRIDHIFDNGTTGYLQWYGNFLRSHWQNTVEKYTSYDNHLEGQLNFTLADRHNISIGGDVSWPQAAMAYG
ncbi:MAG: TonB-dependent receptor plug domain-containing protein, partial [Phycisphaerae bacterium]